MGKYYEIALKWSTVSDDEVNELKAKVRQLLQLGEAGIKLKCETDWNHWSHIDIIVKDMHGAQIHHLTVDRDDVFDLAPTEQAKVMPKCVR